MTWTAASGRPGFLRPTKSARVAEDIRIQHGGDRLAVGITVMAVTLTAVDLARAFMAMERVPHSDLVWVAFGVLALLAVAATVAVVRTGQLPNWLYFTLLSALVIPVALDIYATSALIDRGDATPTAAVAAAHLLLPVATIRGTRTPTVCAAAIALAIAVSTVIEVNADGPSLTVGLAIALLAVVPSLVVALALDGFTRIVARELDLSLVQSTIVTTPAAIGMHASEELAELDHDAEDLLAAVGAGRLPLPVPPDVASRAGTLAARLRMRLIDGRADTWLRHAVAESEALSTRVTVNDTDGDAGRLGAKQREHLLLAIWLIAADTEQHARPVHVTCQPGNAANELRVTLEVLNARPRQLAAPLLEALTETGPFRMRSTRESLIIDVTCIVHPDARTVASAH